MICEFNYLMLYQVSAYLGGRHCGVQFYRNLDCSYFCVMSVQGLKSPIVHTATNSSLQSRCFDFLPNL